MPQPMPPEKTIRGQETLQVSLPAEFMTGLPEDSVPHETMSIDESSG